MLVTFNMFCAQANLCCIWPARAPNRVFCWCGILAIKKTTTAKRTGVGTRSQPKPHLYKFNNPGAKIDPFIPSLNICCLSPLKQNEKLTNWRFGLKWALVGAWWLNVCLICPMPTKLLLGSEMVTLFKTKKGCVRKAGTISISVQASRVIHFSQSAINMIYK